MTRSAKQIAATLRQKNASFLNGAKVNGTYGLELIVGHLRFWNEHGDWRPLHELIRDSISTDADKIRAIVAECVDDSWSFSAKGGFKRDKSKVGGNLPRGVYMNRVAEFAKLASDGASFRGWSKAKEEDMRSEVEKTEAAYAKFLAAYIKMAERADKTLAEIKADAEALKLKNATA